MTMAKKTDMLENPDVTGRDQENEMLGTKASEQNETVLTTMIEDTRKKTEEDAAAGDHGA